jgi:hypothetical protein
MTPTPITITHLGAETSVTGSCHLVDCGIAQGHISKTLWLLYVNDTLIISIKKIR